MEQIHGVDVSWMTHECPKDEDAMVHTRKKSLPSQQGRDAISSSLPLSSSAPDTNGFPADLEAIHQAKPDAIRAAPAQQLPPPSKAEERKQIFLVGATPQRRASWLSSLSSKFSSVSASSQSPPQANNTPTKPAELSVPKANPVKNAVLQHGTRHDGEGPYTPAPPRSPAGIMQVLRRLSSNSGGFSGGLKGNHHGLVARKVLNVDQHRERCQISGLNQAKLRRVAFCVDVEVAPMPRYVEGETAIRPEKCDAQSTKAPGDKPEGQALKDAVAAEGAKDENRLPKCIPEEEPALPKKDDKAEEKETGSAPGKKEKGTKKKEKKKSEEQRRARKEKKRRLAEANGTIPMEIHLDSDASSESVPSGSTKTRATPMTNPVRIYRRCCQLRETPILKRITEQLSDAANTSGTLGVVQKLDLTGYWLQLGDLNTLGDYLAVVPVRQVFLENCGLTDEGLRVILAGLLAAKRADGRRRRHMLTIPDGLAQQGGSVERLVLKNNKIGPEGWKHICLFIYLCRTLKCIDLSDLTFPKAARSSTDQQAKATTAQPPLDLCRLFAKSVAERLGGSTLGLINLGNTAIASSQLGPVIDALMICGVGRLCLSQNKLDAEGVQHVARYLKSGKCEGLDLSSNDLRDHLGRVADALPEGLATFWALSLANCNLLPSSLGQLLPKLVDLETFKFVDLSHNRELFSTSPSAVPMLRRYLPRMKALKRFHLRDCSLSPEQAIALAEIFPELHELAHVNLLENPALVKLTNATTEESREEACALFASLLSAARISNSLVAVDIEVPSEQSSELVKAMAKQVVAYCLQNMERLPISELTAATITRTGELSRAKSTFDPRYPDVLQHLVGHDVTGSADLDGEVESPPDDDYVVGGTGIVKALECCLESRGEESRRQCAEYMRDTEGGAVPSITRTPSACGKAKDMSKHLLLSARKIRQRIQPALSKAKASSTQDSAVWHRLAFLDNTLEGIIKRFEDEFPDTRESIDSGVGISLDASAAEIEGGMGPSTSSSLEAEHCPHAGSGGEGEGQLRVSASNTPRSASISSTSRLLAHEEGRIFRAGNRFRASILRPEHVTLLMSGLEAVASNPNHVHLLDSMIEDLGNEALTAEAREKGVMHVYKEHQQELVQLFRDSDPEHWETFVEAQRKAAANKQKCPAASLAMEDASAVVEEPGNR